MTILLAGDIGGTKTILRLVQAESAIGTSKLLTLKTLHEQTYASQSFPDLVPIVRQMLIEAKTSIGKDFQIDKACFGIAGPVIYNTSELTNLSWSLSGDRLERELAIPQIRLINDFAAIGYGVLGLKQDDLYTLQDVEPDANAPIAVLGAGTGLGEGFLVPLPDGNYRVCGSEGSHADFAPRSLLEFQLMNYIKDKYGIDRVSIERVVSGQGIITIYQFLRDQDQTQESLQMHKIYQAWQLELGKTQKTVDLAAEISKAALNDYLCGQTLQLFIEAYGAEAGNLALKLLSYGGLYVAGGIAPKILPLIKQNKFMKAFGAKGRMSSLLRTIPVHIVLNSKVGLIGAAIGASQL